MTRKEARLIAEEISRMDIFRKKMLEPFIDRKEAARFLCLPISRLAQDITIPVYKVGRRCLYRKSELSEWAENENLKQTKTYLP